jgi:2-isopropylmalate synthase
MGSGNGPIEAFVTALNSALGTDLDVVDYAEHALGAGKGATAVAYVETRSRDGRVLWGVGTDSNIMTASLRAVVSSFLRQRSGASIAGQ